MKTVNPGESLKFRSHYSDSSGAPIDPPEVTFTVYRTVTAPTYGPLRYEDGAGDVAKVDVGVYEVEISVHPNLAPGIYTAQWEALVDGVARYSRSEFQVLEYTSERSGFLDAPRVHGVILNVPTFNDMGLGLTSQLCIVGHCSGLNIGEPYQVSHIQEAIDIIGANQYSPMVRYLLEAHNAGARDIWIMPAAPESEYVDWNPSEPLERLKPRPEFGGKNFYEKYHESYVSAVEILQDWEFPDIIVAPDAPLLNTGDVDFFTPLAESAVQGFLNTGRFRIGFIGALVGSELTNEDVELILADERLIGLKEAESSSRSYDDLERLLRVRDGIHDRLNSFGAADGKTMFTVFGEGTISPPGIRNSYSHSVINTVAAMTAATLPEASIVYRTLPAVVAPSGRSLTKDQVNRLSRSRINPITQTTRGRRGEPFNTVLASDHTLAFENDEELSVFWSLYVTRVVQDINKNIRAISNKKLGTIQFSSFRDDVERYLSNLVIAGRLRDFRVTIERDPTDFNTVLVNLMVVPFGSVREVFFSVEIGSGSAVVDNLFRNAP